MVPHHTYSPLQCWRDGRFCEMNRGWIPCSFLCRSWLLLSTWAGLCYAVTGNELPLRLGRVTSCHSQLVPAAGAQPLFTQARSHAHHTAGAALKGKPQARTRGRQPAVTRRSFCVTHAEPVLLCRLEGGRKEAMAPLSCGCLCSNAKHPCCWPSHVP